MVELSLFMATGAWGLFHKSAYNNIRFTDGTLQDAANDVTLDVNRNILDFWCDGQSIPMVTSSRSTAYISGAGGFLSEQVLSR